VTDFDKPLRQLVRDLTETLRDAGGAGLAAPQIGVGLRVFAYSVGGERGYLVNPSLSFPDEDEQDGPEGCMSFPGLYYDVKRRQNAVASGFTDRGDPVQLVGSATLARCMQHETDHLGRHLVHRPDGPRHQETGHAGDPRGVLERSRPGRGAAGTRLPAPPGRPRAVTPVMAWMPQPCCQSGMKAASTPYEQGRDDGRIGTEVTGGN